MSSSTISDESEIINLAIIIFQNVGIKRWIDHIEILKTEQIYFEICKIIFPQTIIHLFRLSQNNHLSTGQKIQGVIDLIAKLIRNDLYHISGQAIAQGKTNHLKNFLQLLEALSITVIPKDRIQVQSAPDNDRSMTIDDHHSYYTVIGMDKEFKQNIYYTESATENGTEEQDGDRKTNQCEADDVDQGQDADDADDGDTDDFPIKPVDVPNVPTVKDKKQVQQSGKSSIYKAKPRRERVAYPMPLKQKTRNQFQENNKWVYLTAEMNQTKLGLEEQKIQEMKDEYLIWKKKAENESKKGLRQIEEAVSKRKKFINNRINTREEILMSLDGEEQACWAIKDLFRQEKKAKKIKQMEKKKKEQAQMNKIMDFDELNKLLEHAVAKRPLRVGRGE